MIKCTDCSRDLEPLDVFPEGRCLECHAEVTPMPTAEEVIAMWSGKPVKTKEN